MKFTCYVQINLPVARVVSLWNDEANFINWQDGFSRKVLLEGKKDEPGTKSKIIYFQGLGQMELFETIYAIIKYLT